MLARTGWLFIFLSTNLSKALTILDIFVNTFGSTPSKVDAPTSDPVQSSSETRNHGQMRFHEITSVTAHNAHANNFAAGDNIARQLYSNQEYSIYNLLKYQGVRGLMLDIKYDASDPEGIKLVHGPVTYNLLSDILSNEITPFLDENPDAIITLDLQTVGDRMMLSEQLSKELGRDFARRIFRMTSSRWRGYKDWPTIQEMRESDQRVIILADSLVIESESLGIMWRNSVVMENHWEGGLDTCTNRYGSTGTIPWTSNKIAGYRRWSRLFTMNHFCCATGIESSERTKIDLPGGGDNGWGILYPRVIMCTAANGQGIKPNYIAIDWAHLGNALEVADYLTIGGKIGGIGQSCNTGLDCATGSCSHKKRCQCQLCDADSMYCSGCNAGQSCISIKGGENVCSSSTSSALRNSGVLDQELSLHIVAAAVIIAVLVHPGR